MKKLIITAAALMIAASAYGQGQFLFNTRDTAAGNVLTFVDAGGAKVANPNYFVQVLAGADQNSLQPVSGLSGTPLAINRPLSSGGASGFTNPFSDTYVVPGLAGGKQAFVGYVAYSGASYSAGAEISPRMFATSPVTLTEPPTPPNEVALGTQSVVVGIPEPATWALGLLGLGTLLAIRRRK